MNIFLLFACFGCSDPHLQAWNCDGCAMGKTKNAQHFMCTGCHPQWHFCEYCYRNAETKARQSHSMNQNG